MGNLVLIRIEYADHNTEIEVELTDGESAAGINHASILDFAKKSCLDKPVRIIMNSKVIYPFSKGAPGWDTHDWSQVFFFEGKWFGTRDGWDLHAHISNEWKGKMVSLLRDDGDFICHGTYDGYWQNSLTKRPASFNNLEV